MKQDFAKPFFYREKSKFRQFVESWAGFIIVILMLIFGGAEYL